MPTNKNRNISELPGHLETLLEIPHRALCCSVFFLLCAQLGGYICSLVFSRLLPSPSLIRNSLPPSLPLCQSVKHSPPHSAFLYYYRQTPWHHNWSLRGLNHFFHFIFISCIEILMELDHALFLLCSLSLAQCIKCRPLVNLFCFYELSKEMNASPQSQMHIIGRIFIFSFGFLHVGISFS